MPLSKHWHASCIGQQRQHPHINNYSTATSTSTCHQHMSNSKGSIIAAHHASHGQACAQKDAQSKHVWGSMHPSESELPSRRVCIVGFGCVCVLSLPGSCIRWAACSSQCAAGLLVPVMPCHAMARYVMLCLSLSLPQLVVLLFVTGNQRCTTHPTGLASTASNSSMAALHLPEEVPRQEAC
jgi:hypothetical protein